MKKTIQLVLKVVTSLLILVKITIIFQLKNPMLATFPSIVLSLNFPVILGWTRAIKRLNLTPPLRPIKCN